MKTIEIKLFNFTELSEEVQKILIAKHYDINIFEDWHDSLIEDFTNELTEAGFTDTKIYYSGFSSQGDGLSFDGTIDIDKFAETTNEKRVAKLINNGEIENFVIRKTSFANHYSHSKTRYVDCDSVDQKSIQAILEALEAKINDKRLELCEDFYRRLEKEYDSLQSEEAVRGTLEENETTYLENGKVFNE